MSASAAQWHCPAFSLLTRWPESTPALAFAFQETHVSIGVNELNTFLLCLFCCDAWDWRLPTNNINSRLDSVNVNSIFVLRSKSVSHLSRDSVTLSLCDTSRHVTRDTGPDGHITPAPLSPPSVYWPVWKRRMKLSDLSILHQQFHDNW